MGLVYLYWYTVFYTLPALCLVYSTSLRTSIFFTVIVSFIISRYCFFYIFTGTQSSKLLPTLCLLYFINIVSSIFCIYASSVLCSYLQCLLTFYRLTEFHTVSDVADGHQFLYQNTLFTSVIQNVVSCTFTGNIGLSGTISTWHFIELGITMNKLRNARDPSDHLFRIDSNNKSTTAITTTHAHTHTHTLPPPPPPLTHLHLIKNMLAESVQN